MRLTIIPSDNNVGVDNEFLIGLDLANCNIPANIHALQWYGTEGEIEFIDNPDRTKPMNKIITELPTWANACITTWREEKIRQEDVKAEILLAQQAAEAEAQAEAQAQAPV